MGRGEDGAEREGRHVGNLFSSLSGLPVRNYFQNMAGKYVECGVSFDYEVDTLWKLTDA